MRVSAHPGLYDPTPVTPTLNGVTCAECGLVYFPPIGLGCEVCGAPEERLEHTTLAADGVVHAAATVTATTRAAAPFTVAEIVLDSGPLIRAMIHPDSPAVNIGDRATARWQVTGHDPAGREIVEPGFTSYGRENGDHR